LEITGELGLGAAVVTIVAWTVAGSTARAAVTNDREYRLGEGAGENGSAGAVVGSGHYAVQLVMGDNRGFDMSIWGDQATDGPDGTEDITFQHGGDNNSKLVTGTFFADASGSQSLYVRVPGVPAVPFGFPGHFNAMQLREIPEPSSLVISGLGLLCLGVSGRRRKK